MVVCSKTDPSNEKMSSCSVLSKIRGEAQHGYTYQSAVEFDSEMKSFSDETKVSELDNEKLQPFSDFSEFVNFAEKKIAVSSSEF